MANRYWVGGAGTWDASDTTHWAASSNGAGGQSVPGASDAVIFDANSGGGKVTVAYNPTITSITQDAHTGELDMNTRNPTMVNFRSAGTGARTLTMGSGIWTITGNNLFAFNTSTTTNLIFTATTATINFTYAGATGTRTITIGSVVFGGTINITAGTDIINLQMGTGGGYNNIDFTGFSGSVAGGSGTGLTINGNLTLALGMTTAATDITHLWDFRGGGATQTITSHGVVLNHGVSVSNASVVVLADKLDQDTSPITIASGTFNANNQDVTCNNLVCNNSTLRTLIMGNGLWTLTGTGTVWNMTTATNLTVQTAGNGSTIKITNASNTAITFAGGGKTFNNIWFARGASTATNTLTEANTFNNFKDDGSEAHSIVFPNATTTVTSWTVSGTIGKLITLSRTGASGQFTLSKSSGVVSADAIVLSNSNATGGATWYAGSNSTDGGNNTGWLFEDAPATSYTLTYTAGDNGSITGTTPQTVNQGSNGTEVTAVPDSGYQFVKWSDDVMTAARTDTNVQGDITVSASFELIPESTGNSNFSLFL